MTCLYTTVCRIYAAVRRPTYGELIDLFEEVECGCPNDEDLLCSKFRVLYPKVYIGRPRRFYETVLRIVAPAKPSLTGESRLTGSSLASYPRRSSASCTEPINNGRLELWLLALFCNDLFAQHPIQRHLHVTPPCILSHYVFRCLCIIS